jgi:hypothetical protein
MEALEYQRSLRRRRERIEALRNTTGRTSEEAAAYLAKAMTRVLRCGLQGR